MLHYLILAIEIGNHKLNDALGIHSLIYLQKYVVNSIRRTIYKTKHNLRRNFEAVFPPYLYPFNLLTCS